MAKQKQTQETVVAPPAPAVLPPSTEKPPTEWWVGIRVLGRGQYDVMAFGSDGSKQQLESGVDIAVARHRILLHAQKRLFHPAD